MSSLMSYKDKFSTFSYLSCIRSQDGQQLFDRSFNFEKNLDQIIPTLNSIFTFGQNHGFKMHSLDSNNMRIVWKMYHSSLTLILIEPLEPYESHVLFSKLDSIFDAMVLVYGLDDLINISDVEKTKYDIKISFKLIDSILKNDKYDLFGGYLTGCVDLIFVNQIELFQNVLDKTCVSINTSYVCLIFNGRIITASQAWWQLKPIELNLISLLCLTLSDSTCRDIPIYLPNKNPHQPLRLLSFSLTDKTSLCCICSEKPSIYSVEPIIKKLWHTVYNSLINLNQYFPRNLANSITLDQNMIAFLLINKKTKCCTSSLCPNDKISKTLSPDEAKNRFQLIKYFYLNMSTNFLTEKSKQQEEAEEEVEEEEENKLENVDDENVNDELTTCNEAYSIYFDCKCYALNDEFYQFYAIYNHQIPTYATRGVTKKNFSIIMNYS